MQTKSSQLLTWRLLTWNDVPQEKMNPLVARQVIHTTNMSIARIHLARGAVVPLHQHANEQVTTVETGSLMFRMAGQEIVLSAGHILEIPSDLPHEVEALEDSVAVDVFSPPRQDWIQGDDAYLRR
jgi:quercetin dioxygenase-like cupin family protein